MTGPARRPEDDALDRLEALSGPPDSIRGQALATVREVLERLREELLFTARRPDDQEKIDAWWRARSEVKVDGNSRAEYVLQRDAAWERAEAAEAENRRLREGLRAISAEASRGIRAENRLPFLTHIGVIAETTLAGDPERHARALLSASPSDGDDQ